MTGHRRQHAASLLGLGGAALGLAAGTTQLLVGARVPDWTGDKQHPVALGLLTIALSALAGAGAWRLDRVGAPTAPRRLAAGVALLGPGALCFSTVGRLWFVPGLLLVAAAVLALSAGPAREMRSALRAHWAHGLVSALGLFEVLMAVSSSSRSTLAVGVVGGLAVAAAPWLGGRDDNNVTVVLLVVGAVPFALLTWWSVASPLVAVLALALGLATVRRHGHHGRARPVAR